MSYARWGDDSNVYVFDSCAGRIECCGCGLQKESLLFSTSGEIISHLNEHRAKGDLVPDYTYKEILEDYPDLNVKITHEQVP